MIKRFMLLLGFVFIIYAPYAQADVSGDLGHFFSSLGYEGNVTKGHAYEGQEAGYYSGGSLFLRNRVRSIQLVHIDTPSFRSGCGGIDLFAGGFSFVNAKQLTEFFQKIMSNAAGYALNLALETEVPEIAHAMQYIQSIAQKINNSNISSCDMAEDLVGGMWPKERASQQQVCQDIGTQDNAFSDWAAARQGCSTGDDFNHQMNDASKDARYKDRVIINKNIIWNALMKEAFLSDDTQLAELMMSLSGTLIFDSNGKATVLFPQADNRNIINALLYGGSATIYRCDDTTSCLNPSKQAITISADKGLAQQVSQLISQLVQETQSDTPITDQQKGFLNTVSMPILKFINVALSLKSGVLALNLTDYSELIAKDLLKQYMTESLETVKEHLTSVDTVNRAQLIQQIQATQQAVNESNVHAHQNLSDSMALIKNVRFLEQQVTTHLSAGFRNNITFGKS